MKHSPATKFALLILISIGITFFLTYYFVKPAYQGKNSLPTFNQNINGVNEINLGSFDDSNRLKFFRSQISAPTDYFATDDIMLSPFDSQGGMAPPRLVLTKGRQVLGNYFNEVVNNPVNDCIVVWSTNGFTSIDDWNNSITGFEGELKNNEAIKIGSRTVTTGSLKLANREIYVALLPVGNTDNTTYYFHTCNANNKADFLNVIKSIKFRADLNL